MFRKTILASTLSLLLTPGAAWALGVGGIRTESALNQPFAAEIDLVGANPDELDAVKVTLASEAEFAKRGADRQHYLTKLSFKPQISPRGKPVVRVTSAEPIREPYMNLLIEVAWPKGRLVREYTVLLDPPVTARRAPPAVERPVADSLAAAIRKDASPPSAERPERTRAAAPVVQPPTRTTTQPTATGDVFPLRYGPVKSGTGLWRVANKVAPSGATVAQTAMALYRNNQGAFVQGDINRLRQGVVLQIPTSAELFALDVAKAEAEFRSALAGKRVTAKPLTDVTAATGEEQARLKIAGAAKPGKLGASAAVPAVSAQGAPSSGDIEQELLLVRETGESTRQETDELRARVRELEESLTDIRSLLTLRNAELDRLRGAPAPATPGASPSDARPVMPAEGQAVVGEPGAGLAAGMAEPTEQPAAEPPAAGGATPVVTEARDHGGEGTAPQAELQGAPGAGEAPVAAVPKPPEPVRTTPVEPGQPGQPAGAATPPAGEEPEASALGDLPLVGDLFANVPAPVLWTGLVAAPVLGVLGWLSIRRRRRIDESLSALGLPSSLDLHDQPGATPSPPWELPEATAKPGVEPKKPPASASMFDETAGSGEAADVADAISEADIYVAYGRYRDAQRLLKQAMVRAPHGVDLHYKLAEIYVGSKDYAALAALLKDMEIAGMDQVHPDQWRRLVDSAATRHQPGEPSADQSAAAGTGARLRATAALAAAPLFGDGPGNAGADEVPVDEDIEIVTEHLFSGLVGGGQGLTLDESDRFEGERLEAPDLDLDFGELDFGNMPVGGSAALPGFDSDLDRQTGHQDLELTMADLVQATPGDLAALGVRSTSTGAPPSPGSQPTPEPGSGFGEDSVEAMDTQASTASVGHFPESELELDWGAPVPPHAAPPTPGFGIEPETGHFEIGAIAPDAGSSDLLSSHWQMDGGMWDEIGTKLDLGRAYVEMNDLDAAQAILSEVIEEGNADQQKEARGLLAQLKGH
jgi:pilus assembly protein FimV